MSEGCAVSAWGLFPWFSLGLLLGKRPSRWGAGGSGWEVSRTLRPGKIRKD